MLRPLLTLMYHSGLRISEMLAVRSVGVDMRRHRIRRLGAKSGHTHRPAGSKRP